MRKFFHPGVTADIDLNNELTDIENILAAANEAAIMRLNTLVERGPASISYVHELSWKTVLASPLRTSLAGYSGAQTIGSSRADVITDRDVPGVGDLRVEVTNTHGTPTGIAHSTVVILDEPPDGRSFVCLFVMSLSVVAVETRTHASGGMATFLIDP